MHADATKFRSEIRELLQPSGMYKDMFPYPDSLSNKSNSYLHNIYIVLSILSQLEMIWCFWEDMQIFFVQISPISYEGFKMLGFRYSWTTKWQLCCPQYRSNQACFAIDWSPRSVTIAGRALQLKQTPRPGGRILFSSDGGYELAQTHWDRCLCRCWAWRPHWQFPWKLFFLLHRTKTPRAGRTHIFINRDPEMWIKWASLPKSLSFK